MNAGDLACHKCDKDRNALGRLLAAVLAVCDAGIVVFDEQGRFVMANPAFQSLFRWRKVSVHSETFASLFPDTKLPSSVVRLPRSVSAGRYDTRVRSGDGALVDVEVHARWITQEEEDSYWVAALTPKAVVNAQSAARPDDPVHPAVTDAGWFDHAVRRAIRDAQSGPYVVAGQVQMTKLAPVRQAAGTQWPKVASHIFAEAERILTQNLLGTDAYVHDGEGGFTICFGDASLGEAERRTADIEQDIRSHLTGQFGVASAPDAHSHVDQIALLPGEAEVPDIGALIASRLAEKRAIVEQASNTTLTQVIGAASLETQDVVRQDGSAAPLLVVRLDRTTSRAVQRISAVSRNAGDVTNQVDHLLLGLTATRIYESLARTVPPTFVVPVSFATFTNRRLTDRYLGLCRSLAAGVAQHLMFELVGVPDDAASMRIEEIIACLRPFSRHQCLRLPRLDRGAVKSWSRHFSHFTILFDSLDVAKREVGALQPLLNTLHQQRGRLGVQNVPDQDTARTLTEASVDFVSGVGLAPWRAP